MTTEHDATQIVRSWLKTDEHESAERVVGIVLDRLASTPQVRPLWRSWTRPLLQGTFKFAAAALAVMAALGVGLAVYFSRPTAPPAASPSPSASPIATDPAVIVSPSPGSSAAPTLAGEPTTSVTPDPLVAYPVCASTDGPTTCRLWVANSDGTDPHELIPHVPNPDLPDFQNSTPDQYPRAWSADGSRLLFSYSRVEYSGPQDGVGTLHIGLALTDASGSEPEEFESLCPADPPVETDQYNFCEVGLDHTAVVAFAPDGTRVAYTVHEDWGSGDSEVEATSLAILELTTGTVTRLESTLTTNPVVPDQALCATAASEGYNSAPAWSPDGTLVAFVRSGIGPAVGEGDSAGCQNGLFTVNVDTGEVSEITMSREIQYQGAQWSSDDSQLLFHGFDAAADTLDVYTIRPDGSDLRALTSDGSSMWPNWTRDERVVFLRGSDVEQSETWLMEVDGSGGSQLEESISALTAAGCVVCPSPIGGNQFFNLAFWQPITEEQL